MAHPFETRLLGGLDPALNIAVKDVDEILEGKPHPRFGLFISETAAQILEHKPKLMTSDASQALLKSERF